MHRPRGTGTMFPMDNDEPSIDPLEALEPAAPLSAWDATGETSFFATSRGKLMAVVISVVSLAAVIPIVLIPLFTGSRSSSPASVDPAVRALDAYVEFWRTGGGAPTAEVATLLDEAVTVALPDGSTQVSLTSTATGLCWTVIVGGPTTPRPEATDASQCTKAP